jgi:protein-tyrosine phosphatase
MSLRDNIAGMSRILRSLATVTVVAALASPAVATASPEPAAPSAHKTVIFVDTGNTGRSVMAREIAAKYLASKHWTDITVAGRGTKVDPTELAPEKHAVELLAARGIDVSSHVAAQLTAADVAGATVILPVSQKNEGQVVSAYPTARTKTHLLSQYAIGANTDIEDAWGKDYPAYQQAAAQLDQYVPEALAKVHAQH